jgi:hypothetical protein
MVLGDGLTAAWGGKAFLAAQPLQDNADLAQGGMVLPCGASNIADQFFGGYALGWAEDFWLIFTLLGVTISRESSVPQITTLVP